MIICVCRNISQSDFSTTEELIERILEMDHNCGKCKEYCQSIIQAHKNDIDKNKNL